MNTSMSKSDFFELCVVSLLLFLGFYGWVVILFFADVWSRLTPED